MHGTTNIKFEHDAVYYCHLVVPPYVTHIVRVVLVRGPEPRIVLNFQAIKLNCFGKARATFNTEYRN